MRDGLEALTGIRRSDSTVHWCLHDRQTHTMTITPRSRRTSARPTQTLEAAHSGQGDFIPLILQWCAHANGEIPLDHPHINDKIFFGFPEADSEVSTLASPCKAPSDPAGDPRVRRIAADAIRKSEASNIIVGILLRSHNHTCPRAERRWRHYHSRHGFIEHFCFKLRGNERRVMVQR